MSKIDWTKPIETLSGNEARLLHVLKKNESSYKYLVLCCKDDHEYMLPCDADGYHLGHIPSWRFGASPFVRNKAEGLTLYGRLEPYSPGNVEGMGWTSHRGASDTHVMELAPDDVVRIIKQLEKAP